ncbi:cell surface protein [uncultured Winogradskyella sp.]|uniref:tetratricopeptide repeat protein n=1 Tax=uncultured Winogradskyella sp. TaxID=395353 RepID=UPI0026308863|nr:cell surface protein [uncultured Winogradskyella sp.]
MRLNNILPLIILVLFFSCNSNEVTDKKDYTNFITTKLDITDLSTQTEILSNKIEAIPNQFTQMAKRASVYTRLFNATGDISYLIKAENDLKAAIAITGRKFPSFLKGLATNYISQHRFIEALELLKEAEANGEKLNGTKKMLFDVHLELGNYLAAESYLNDIRNTSDFDYLIRLAKWEDHKGNLDGAIEQMEKATRIAESMNSKSLKQWSYTNLADFYGHAGDLKKSYNHYLKALDLDANNAYAKKGIAWILYSYENKPDEALHILDHISTYYYAPDYDLLRAEIADYTNNTVLKSKALNNYKKAVSNPSYGDMYNKYNVMLYTEDFELTNLAIKIAEKEVANRPTPQSYDLLAWSYFKTGDIKKANAIVETYVDGQTSEPEVLYHIAEIYKAVGKTDKIYDLKTELIASIYELGPTMASKIKQL